MSDILVVGYYTDGNGYETEARRMMESVARFGFTHEVEAIPIQNWQKATQYKPLFLLSKAIRHPGRVLLYLDADAEMVAMPDLGAWSADFAVPFVDWADYGKRPRREVISAAILMRATQPVQSLLAAWAINNTESPQEGPGLFEQHNLEALVRPALEGRATVPGVNIERLPDRYSQIFDSMAGNEPPVIIQHQASRRLRK